MMTLKAILVSVLAVAIVGCACPQVAAQTGSHMITAQMRANALANVEKHDWAKKLQQNHIGGVRRYVEMSDEELWRIVPSQWVPRNLHVLHMYGKTQTSGCPNCGKGLFKVKGHAYNLWAHGINSHPWKLKCKNCGTLFPSNDYGAYYESGLDDRGEFDPEKADKSLLFNPAHPDPEDPDHKKWVDDGFGLKNGDDTLTVVARCCWLLWGRAMVAADNLARAYVLTSDPIYAHKAAILLDRYADVYPSIDYSFVAKQKGWGISDGGSRKGMIAGCIWETALADKLAWTYDVIYEQLLEDQELVAFCAKMREKYPGLADKPTNQAIARHIEDNLITLFCEAVIDENIKGNVGSHQRSMAMAAIALDRPDKTEAYLDWLFRPHTGKESGGQIAEILTDLVCRDGPSWEAAIGYSLSPRVLYVVADLLQSYQAYTKCDMYRDYPQMKQLFLATRAYRCLNQVNPMIGDAGNYQTWSDARQRLPMLISGFRAYGSEDLAHEMWHSARYDIENIRAQRGSVDFGRGEIADIFRSDEERTALTDRLATLKPELPIRLRSVNNGGYGLAILQTDNPDNGRCVYLWYGRTGGHSHQDRLNFGIFAKHMVMNPDLGYPEFTGNWPKRFAWTSHAASHNTVLVNDRTQTCNWGGKTELFIGGDLARVAIVDSPPNNRYFPGEPLPVYVGVRTYKRAVSLIDISDDDSYVVDVFWVRGGTNHRMVSNGAGRQVTCQNIQLTRQAAGTFAGPDIQFAVKPATPEKYGAPYNPDEQCLAFSYLRDVERGNATADSCWIDWDLVHPNGTMEEGRDPHLRMHCLSPVDEIAIATGEPPHKVHQDDYLRHVVRSRLGEDIESQFVTVLEPYEPEPFIASTKPLKLDAHDGEGSAAAVQVDLKDGRSDIIIIAEEPCHVEAGGLKLDGQMGFIRLRDGKVEAAKLVRGTKLEYGDYVLKADRGEITGKLAGFDVSDWKDNLLKVGPSVLPDGVKAADLIGQYIIVKNSERSDGSYLIRDVRENGTVISLGDKTLIERFIDRKDYDKGYIYNVAEGDEFTIPLSVMWQKEVMQ